MSASFINLERQSVLAPLGVSFRDASTGETVGDGLDVNIYPSANPTARTRAFPNRSGVYVVHAASGLQQATHGAGDRDFWAGLSDRKAFTVEVTDERRRYLPFRFGVGLPVRGPLTWVWPLEASTVAQPAKPPVRFRDDFDDSLFDASLWRLGTLRTPQPGAWDEAVSVREWNGRLEVTPRSRQSGEHYNGYVSAATWSVRGARASVEAAQLTLGAAETTFTLALDPQNWFRFVARAGQLMFRSRAANVETSAAVAYDPAPHRFWSFRHDRASDQVSFETSADGRTWARQRVVPRPFPLSAMTVELGAGTSTSVVTPGAALFDNFIFESSPIPFIPLFSAPTRSPQGGMAVLRAELWDPLPRGGEGAPAAYALLEASLAGRQTLRAVADAKGRVALVFPYPEPAGAGGTVPPPAYTSQEWEVRLRAFYTPRGEVPPLPDLPAVFEQPAARLWSDEARTQPLTKATLRFGRELVLRSHRTNAGAPLEPTPLPVLLITPAT